MNMTTKEYLQAILKQESLSNDSDEIKAIWKERENVENIIATKFSSSSPTIRYGGGKAKGTMIRSNYDLDIVCYFPHDEKDAGETLEEIYNNVKEALQADYFVEAKNSALRLLGKSGANKGVYFHIDVVPGRYVDDKSGDAFLYQNEGDKARLKTNLETHISHIRDSGLQDVIKLGKLWKKRAGLQLRTFILELLIIEVVKGCDKNSPEDCLKKFWKELRDNINDITVEDPANPMGNNLSPYFDDSMKSMLSSAASIAMNNVDNDNWDVIFGAVETLSAQEIATGISAVRASNPGAPRLYGGDL